MNLVVLAGGRAYSSKSFGKGSLLGEGAERRGGGDLVGPAGEVMEGGSVGPAENSIGGDSVWPVAEAREGDGNLVGVAAEATGGDGNLVGATGEETGGDWVEPAGEAMRGALEL